MDIKSLDTILLFLNYIIISYVNIVSTLLHKFIQTLIGTLHEGIYNILQMNIEDPIDIIPTIIFICVYILHVHKKNCRFLF